MLIRILELDYHDDKDPYKDARFIAAYNEPNYAEFVHMIKELKDNDEEYHITIDDEWHTIDTYVFNCPKNKEYLPCINVYVL